MTLKKNFKSILIKNIKIVDSNSPFHESRKNILIKNGIICEITNTKITESANHIIDGSNQMISVGWFDLGTSLNEPGFEHKDELKTLANSAALGGFTELATLPNTNPVIQSKESIKYLISVSEELSIGFYPIAVLTDNAKGKAISEMIDLSKAGAVAFSDGKENAFEADVLKQALLYLQSIDGLLIYYPDNKMLYTNGQMHEGKTSTMLGLKGIPSIAEHSAVQNAISLLKYTGGKIHFANISTKEAVNIIRKAKKEGLKVSCDISAHQIAFSNEDLLGFDTNLKVKPPFRSKDDIDALWDGIIDNTVDAIVSSHTPQDQEGKFLEFDSAEFGILGLETLFPVLISNKPEYVSVNTIVDKISASPRKILGNNNPTISIGNKANLTLFDTAKEWQFELKHIYSKSKNSPFIGANFLGKVNGVIIGNCVFCSGY